MVNDLYPVPKWLGVFASSESLSVDLPTADSDDPSGKEELTMPVNPE